MNRINELINVFANVCEDPQKEIIAFQESTGRGAVGLMRFIHRKRLFTLQDSFPSESGEDRRAFPKRMHIYRPSHVQLCNLLWNCSWKAHTTA